MTSAERAERGPDRTVERVIKMLDLLAEGRPEGTGVRSSAESTGLSKSAVQRLLQSLTDLDVAEKLPSGRYVAGGRFAQWAGSSALQSMALSAADHEMQAMVRQYGETVYLTRYLPAAREAVFIHVVESETPLRYRLPLGLRIPLHAGAAGKAILAHLGEDVIDEITLSRFTDRTIVKKAELKAELALIRGRGYAVSRGERIEGAGGIAAAYWRNGILTGSITMTVPQQNLDEQRCAQLGNAAKKAAETVSCAFGAVPDST